MGKTKQKKGTLWTVLTIVLAVLTVISAVAIPVTSYFSTAINVTLGAATQKVIADPNAQIFFWSNYENEEDLVAFEIYVIQTSNTLVRFLFIILIASRKQYSNK